jgi:hypothetical protein
MKTPSYTIASDDDIYCDELILDEPFDMHDFFGKSYDSWVENIFGNDKNDSTSTGPPTKEDKAYCIDV